VEGEVTYRVVPVCVGAMVCLSVCVGAMVCLSLSVCVRGDEGACVCERERE